MNAYRKLVGIVAIAALTCMAGALSPAFAQGHGGHGEHGAAGGGGGGAHGHFAGGGAHGHFAGGGGHGGFGGSHYAGGFHGGGFRGGGFYGHGYYGHGGYWHGGFYGPRFGFGWYLPLLPAFYATYWYGGVPYYYANDAYYTWSPDYNGYVATDPPAGAEPAGNDNQPPPAAGGQSYNYPKNGQTDEQQATDRYQCHQWAVSQSGYDPTRNAAPTAGGQQTDYHRAVTACMEGRGYSVK